MRQDDARDTGFARFAYQHQVLGGGGVAGRQRQVVLRHDAEHLQDFGQQLAVAGDGDFAGVEGGHPDDLGAASFEGSRLLNSGDVDPADRAIQDDTAVDFDARHGASNDVGELYGRR